MQCCDKISVPAIFSNHRYGHLRSMYSTMYSTLYSTMYSTMYLNVLSLVVIFDIGMTETEVAQCSPTNLGKQFFKVGSLNEFAGVTAAQLPTFSFISLITCNNNVRFSEKCSFKFRPFVITSLSCFCPDGHATAHSVVCAELRCVVTCAKILNFQPSQPFSSKTIGKGTLEVSPPA